MLRYSWRISSDNCILVRLVRYGIILLPDQNHLSCFLVMAYDNGITAIYQAGNWKTSDFLVSSVWYCGFDVYRCRGSLRYMEEEDLREKS